MSDEKTVILRKRIKVAIGSASKRCIIHYTHSTDTTVKSLTETSLEAIQNVAKVRQLTNAASSRLDFICSSIPSTFDRNLHGFHRWCYQNFTNITKI